MFSGPFKDSDMLVAIVCSIFAGVATNLITYLFVGDTGDLAYLPYLGYLVILPCIAVGIWRPFAAVLSSFMLLAINPGNTIAHTFTSAPSDYLIMAATASLIFRSWRHFKSIPSPVIAAFLIVLSATISLGTAFHNDTIPIDKIVVAEYLGMLNMACYIAAPAIAVRSIDDFRSLSNALCLGVVPLFLGAIAGSADTLFCYTDGINQMYTTAGFRDKGTLGDPNVFAIVVASLLPLTVLACRRFGMTWPFVAAVVGAALIVLSGSRTGVGAGLLASVLALLFVNRSRSWIISASNPIIVLLVMAPTLWGSLPCMVGGPKDRVLLNERGSETAYSSRLLLRDTDVVTLNHDFPALRDLCFRTQEKELPLTSVANDRSVRNCVLQYLASTLPDPDLEKKAYKKSPLAAMMARLPIDRYRRLLWDHAIAIGFEHPVFGVGLSNLTRMTPNNWRSHNTYLTTFAEQGLVGVWLLIGTIVITVLAGFRGLRGMTPRDRGTLIAVLLGIIVNLVGAGSQDIIRQQTGWALLGLFATASFFAKPLADPVATPKVSS
jgi:hypothetical protein